MTHDPPLNSMDTHSRAHSADVSHSASSMSFVVHKNLSTTHMLGVAEDPPGLGTL